MSNYNIPDKSAGNTWPAVEHNLLKAAVNSKMGFENPATYSAMSTDPNEGPRWVVVEVDETNGFDSTLYIHNGIAPRFVMILNPIV